MQDVFVSYSRRDREFVRRLVQGLQARGKEVWLDTEGIRDGEVFPDAIRSAVEGSNAFVFVISPESVASPFCNQEVDHALEHHKQVVPLVYRRVPDPELPEPIRVRNWIPFETEDGFDAGLGRLVEALDTDLEWTEQHTRWLLKSREWEREGRDRSFLLRGAEMDTAERWLTTRGGQGSRAHAVAARVRLREPHCRHAQDAAARGRDGSCACGVGRARDCGADAAQRCAGQPAARRGRERGRTVA